MKSQVPLVLVHEFFSGGGRSNDGFSRELLLEGAAMLQSVLADFHSWGQVRTVSILDQALQGFDLAADDVLHLPPNRFWEVLPELAARCDAALIVAPETGGILARLSSLVERVGARLLGASPSAVSVAADKWECHRRFVKAGLPRPRASRVSRGSVESAAREIGFPLVVKPLNGAGCEGVCLVRDQSALRSALTRPDLQDAGLLLEEYVDGVHASISLLASPDRSVAIGLNQQMITVGSPFSFQGCMTPLEHALKESAIDVAQRAVGLIPGIVGYVGVDMVLTDDRCHLIEINPRLTSSYVSLREVADINLAKAIWRVCWEGFLPDRIEVIGRSAFSKDQLLDLSRFSSTTAVACCQGSIA